MVIAMVKLAAKRFFTHHGSKDRKTYKVIPSRTSNTLELLCTGKEDFQAYIESFKDSCDINVIIRRISNGELDLLTAQTGSYGDFSNMPTNLQDVYSAGMAARTAYESLSDEQKTKFSSFEEFAATAGTMDWIKKLGYDIEPPEEKESEVSE